MSEYHVGPCSQTHGLKCSNATQGMAEDFVPGGGGGGTSVCVHTGTCRLSGSTF